MSIVLAVTCRLRDFDAWWATIADQIQDLVELNATHVVVYRSADDHDRIFATIGIDESASSVGAVLRSPNLLRLFDSGGVEDLPPIFAGHAVEKIDLRGESEQDPEHASSLVASFVVLDSVERLQEHAHSAVERMHAAGVQRYWIYQAFDDALEVLIMRDIATVQQAKRWLSSPDEGITPASGPRFMVYPPPFVGSLVRSIDIPHAGS